LFDEGRPPAQYRNIFKSVDAEKMFLGTDDWTLSSALNGHIELEIFMGAMTSSDIKVTRMELAVDLDEHIAKNLVKVLHIMEGCTVRGNHYFSPEYRPEEDSFAFKLSTSIPCPRLRSLTVEPHPPNLHPGGGIMSLLRWLGVPDVKHITSVGGYSQIRDTIAFLQLFRGIVKSVSLRGMANISYEPILRCLQPLELDILTIDDEFEE
jgi:hypothetical protein